MFRQKPVSILSLLTASLLIPAAFAQCSSSKSSCSPNSPKVAQVSLNGAAPASNIVGVASAAGQFETLIAAVKAAGLVETLSGEGPFTVFAPTDAAFAQIPVDKLANLLLPENRAELTRILTFHVVSGKVLAKDALSAGRAETLAGETLSIARRNGSVFVGNARVTSTDVLASNGVIHIIDTVLLPPSPRATAVVEKPAPMNIVQTAEAAGFSTLLAAAKAAGLAGALQGDGPLTVFAPTDEAFARLPAGTLKSLLEPKNKSKLAEILEYHVVSGRIPATKALSAGKATTLQGSSVDITLNNGQVMIGSARLIKQDISASNGIIHVIDSVLLPPSSETSSSKAGKARQMIEQAIDRGAPLYNRGDVASCSSVYKQTAYKLVAMSDDLPACTSRLQMALRASERSHDHDANAWALRHAFDELYAQMPQD